MAKKRRKGAAGAAKKRSEIFLICLVVLLVLLIAAGACWYFFVYRKAHKGPSAGTEGPSGELPEEPSGGTEAPASEELEIHFLELGNKYAGDCVYVRVGDVDILIDGGSRENSADTIERYVDAYCTDGILEYVIVTHGHQDHIAAFAGNKTYPSLFRRFECRTIIDFPRTNSDSGVYRRYVEERDAEVEAGAVHYTALDCWKEEKGAKRSYPLADGISMNFLYNYYYDHSSSDENNHSVCMYLSQGNYNYLFTGDLEKEGEAYLVEYNELPQCKLYKAGHHGSRTSSTEVLLERIKPEYVCVCCCAGAPEYTKDPDTVFPTREMLERVMKYTDKIYVTSLATNVDLEGKKWDYTSLNGNIVVRSDGTDFTVTGSNHSKILKETEWYAANRA